MIDLLQKHDSNKDGFLTYLEIETFLLDISVAVKPGIFNEILIGEVLDAGKRTSRVSYEIVRFYLGFT